MPNLTSLELPTYLDIDQIRNSDVRFGSKVCQIYVALGQVFWSSLNISYHFISGSPSWKLIFKKEMVCLRVCLYGFIDEKKIYNVERKGLSRNLGLFTSILSGLMHKWKSLIDFLIRTATVWNIDISSEMLKFDPIEGQIWYVWTAIRRP